MSDRLRKEPSAADQTENVRRTMGIPLSNAYWTFLVWSPGMPTSF